MPKIKIKGKMLSPDVAGLGITYSNYKINIKINNNSGLTFSSDNSISLPNVISATNISNISNKSINITQIDNKGRIVGYTVSNYESYIKLKELDSQTASVVSNLILPNNSTNKISDGVFKINLFNGNRPITRSFLEGYQPNTDDINEFLESVFYPSVPPTLSITTPNLYKEYGSSVTTPITWSVTKKTYGIASINVNNTFIGVPSNISMDSSVNGTIATATLNQNSIQNQPSIFTLSVSDTTGASYSSSITVNWGNKRYWGRVDLTSIGNPDLTSNPSLSYLVTNIVTDNLILNLDGAGVGSGSEITLTLNKSYNNIDGSGEYLLFAFPTSFGTPNFTVNGLPNTAFTKVRSNSTFTNTHGYVANYDVWVSNTAQNAPISTFTIN